MLRVKESGGGGSGIRSEIVYVAEELPLMFRCSLSLEVVHTRARALSWDAGNDTT